MWVASEFRLPGHPRPTTESQDIWNDDPPRDSTATSIPSHDLIIGIQSGSVQPLPTAKVAADPAACRPREWRCSHL
jgi:hypothetical protein